MCLHHSLLPLCGLGLSKTANLLLCGFPLCRTMNWGIFRAHHHGTRCGLEGLDNIGMCKVHTHHALNGPSNGVGCSCDPVLKGVSTSRAHLGLVRGCERLNDLHASHLVLWARGGGLAYEWITSPCAPPINCELTLQTRQEKSNETASSRAGHD